jgi:hypothetical protein
MLEYFLCEADVTFGTLRPYVIEKYGLTETGRLGQAHVSRDDGTEHLAGEIASQIIAHLGAQIGPLIIHSEQEPLDGEARIEVAAYA